MFKYDGNGHVLIAGADTFAEVTIRDDCNDYPQGWSSSVSFDVTKFSDQNIMVTVLGNDGNVQCSGSMYINIHTRFDYTVSNCVWGNPGAQFPIVTTSVAFDNPPASNLSATPIASASGNPTTSSSGTSVASPSATPVASSSSNVVASSSSNVVASSSSNVVASSSAIPIASSSSNQDVVPAVSSSMVPSASGAPLKLVQEVTTDNSSHTMKYVLLYIFVGATCLFIMIVSLIVFVRSFWYKNNNRHTTTTAEQTQKMTDNSMQYP
jgi:hypothetical protein